MKRHFAPFLTALFLCVSVGCSDDGGPVLTTGNNGGSQNNGSANNGDTNNGGPECASHDDCPGGRCDDGSCVEGTCSDGVRTGSESDVDCGGPDCDSCDVDQACTRNSDCATGRCESRVCAPPLCDDPGTPERMAEWDIDFDMSIRQTGEYGGPGPVLVSGIGLEDFDGDDDLDMVITNAGSELVYLENTGSGFEEATEAAGLDGLTKTTSVSYADIDNDGDSDLFIGRIEGQFLLENDGAGVFTDVTSAWGLDEDIPSISAGSFADFDGDGLVDLYVSSYVPPDATFPEPQPNFLFRNTGSEFVQQATSPGESAAGTTLAAAWTDIDRDGRPDLWVVNDFGMLHEPNQLFVNQGEDPSNAGQWLFEEVAAQYDFDRKIFGMSATIGDIDNDSDLDYYVSNIANNLLFVNEGGMKFAEKAVTRGVASGHLPDPWNPPGQEPDFTSEMEEVNAFVDDYTNPESGDYTLTSWASIFADLDHDGYQDLFVANGAVFSQFVPESIEQPNYVYMNDGMGTFEEQPCWFLPVDRGASRAAATGDLDGDGDLDLVYVNLEVGLAAGRVVVMKNEASTGNWLQLRLEGTASNPDAIGARVELVAGSTTQTRVVDGGQGFMSSGQRAVHFGLGDATEADMISITWPSGTTQNLTDVAPNQRLVVVEE